MNGGPFDDGVPGGAWEADFDMRELEDAARRAAAMRKAGKCPHGRGQGHSLSPNADRRAAQVPPGMTLCVECGELLDSSFLPTGRFLLPVAADLFPADAARAERVRDLGPLFGGMTDAEA